MNHPDNLMLYVSSPEASAAFYGALFGLQPVEQSPTFVLFILQSGLKLALWSKQTVQPVPANIGGGCEFSMRAETRAEVDKLYENGAIWLQKS